MSVEFYPRFDNVRAQFKSISAPDDQGKVKIFFMTAGQVKDEAGEFSEIPFDLALSSKIATLFTKVDRNYVQSIRHLLIPGVPLLLSIVGRSLSINGAKGVNYVLLDIQKPS